MKTLLLAITASITVAVIASISLFVLPDNRPTCFLCPSISSPASQPLDNNNSSMQNVTTEMQTGDEFSLMNNTKCIDSTCDEKLIYFVGSDVKPKDILYDYSYDGIDQDNGMASINGQTYYQMTLLYTVYDLKK